MPFISRRTLSGGQVVPVQAGATPPDVTDFAGGSPLELPGALAGVLGKGVSLSADELAQLNDLLGKPIKLGQNLVRLSSVDPAKGIAIVHDATEGTRVATPIKDFLKSWGLIGEDTPEQFPEGVNLPGRPMVPDKLDESSVLPVKSQRGVRAEGGTYTSDGLKALKRMIPPTATR